MAKILQLTDGDRAIFRRAKETDNPSIITNFYLRNDDSGTWWRPITDRQIERLIIPEFAQAATRWKDGFDTLFQIWMALKKPEFFSAKGERLTFDQFRDAKNALETVYRVVLDANGAVEAFHHPHGIVLIDWQLRMHRAPHSLLVVAGGFGSAKTYGKLLSMLARAITLPGYRALALAPYSIQAQEVHKQAMTAIQGSLFEKFLIAAPTRPYPHLIFENEYTGRTSIECFPVLEGSNKLLTLTADEALVDQAEQILDLDTLIRDVSSRFRGQIRGRPRIGQITLVANSADNPQLWDYFDEGQVENDFVWSYSPATYENNYLTVADLIRYEARIGKDERSRRMYIFGDRPIGGGEHFSTESLEKIRSKELDAEMDAALNAGTPGYVRRESPRVYVHTWERPPQEGHVYVVAADAGWGNPPERNAACIGVWDITDFPKAPAILTAFDWVFGNNSPNPWISKYFEYSIRYRAIGMNGFDATGTGSGYERMETFQTVSAMPINLNNNRKLIYLNLAKKLVADGMLRVPTITHFFTQCAKYRLPDENIKQDIVMMLLVTAAMLEAAYYTNIVAPDTESDFDATDRYWRPAETDRQLFDYSIREER